MPSPRIPVPTPVSTTPPDIVVQRRPGGGVVARRASKRIRWSQRRREAFLEHLARTANVTFSAEAAGVTTGMAYGLRRRDTNFAADWLVMLDEGYRALELNLLDKALNGEARVVRSAEGESVVIRQDTGLQLRLLAQHRAAVKGAPRVAPRSEETAEAARKRMAHELALIAERLELSAALFPEEAVAGDGAEVGAGIGAGIQAGIGVADPDCESAPVEAGPVTAATVPSDTAAGS